MLPLRTTVGTDQSLACSACIPGGWSSESLLLIAPPCQVILLHKTWYMLENSDNSYRVPAVISVCFPNVIPPLRGCLFHQREPTFTKSSAANEHLVGFNLGIDVGGFSSHRGPKYLLVYYHKWLIWSMIWGYPFLWNTHVILEKGLSSHQKAVCWLLPHQNARSMTLDFCSQKPCGEKV